MWRRKTLRTSSDCKGSTRVGVQRRQRLPPDGVDVVLPARTRGNIVGPSTTWMRETLTSVDIQLEQAGERHVVDNAMAHLRLPSPPRENPGGRLGWSIRHPQPDREDSSSSRRNYDYTRGTQTGTQNDSVPAAYQGGAVTITENPVLGTSNIDARFRPMVTPISIHAPRFTTWS